MTVKDKRRELRISTADDAVLAEAAALLGVSISEFLLTRALVDAQAIIEAHRTITLNQRDYASFLNALDEPMRPPQELIAQVQKARSINKVN